MPAASQRMKVLVACDEFNLPAAAADCRPTMRRLLVAGTEVPRSGLRTNRLQDTAEQSAFVRDAIRSGIRHIDAACLYWGRRAEAAIGLALASGRHDGVVFATKRGCHDDRPEMIAGEIERSLGQLRVDRIDLHEGIGAFLGKRQPAWTGRVGPA